MSYDVAIIGAGIGGIHCAIELKKIGLNPILIEKKPYIGGMAVKIGKSFPNQDCASCISDDGYVYRTQGIRKCLFKKEIDNDLNFQYLTCSNVLDVEKSNDKFLVKLLKNPTYIKENCDLCGLCEQACPILIDDPFNFNWTKKKVISLPFSNSVPQKIVVDRDFCKNCKEECVQACPKNAIQLDAKSESLEIEAKYLVFASGFNEFDARKIKEYNYGEFKNVITQLELARMLDVTGPTKSKVLRPSNWKKPDNALIILCVGSRDIRHNEYCSRICCSYSLKHAIELRNQDIDVTISYLDLRLEDDANYYLKEAQEKNITFINHKVARIEEDPETKKLSIAVELDNNKSDLLFDLVVLTPALIPSNDFNFLESKLGINVGKYGFIHVDEWGFKGRNPEGDNIFTIGCIDSPKNIPQTILQARAISFSILSKEKSK